MKSSKLTTCKNHLGDLFDAIQKGDIKMVQEIEHQLTENEECVACAYALQADTKTKKVLEHYLRQEGFAVSDTETVSFTGSVFFWAVRIGIFLGIYFSIVGFEKLIWVFVFHTKDFNLFSLNVFEFVTVTFLTVLLFILFDDQILD